MSEEQHPLGWSNRRDHHEVYTRANKSLFCRHCGLELGTLAEPVNNDTECVYVPPPRRPRRPTITPEEIEAIAARNERRKNGRPQNPRFYSGSDRTSTNAWPRTDKELPKNILPEEDIDRLLDLVRSVRNIFS